MRSIGRGLLFCEARMALDPDIVAAVQRAIADARDGVIERWAKKPPNAPLFLLCQHLLSVPQTAHLCNDDLLPYVAMFWDSGGSDCSNGTLDAEDAESAFVVLWRSGKVARPCANRLQDAVKAASNGTTPPAEAMRYTRPGYRKLVHVCRELAVLYGGTGEFFLRGADAAIIIGKDDRSGSLALQRLCADGILELLRRGNQTARRASLYRYCGPLS